LPIHTLTQTANPLVFSGLTSTSLDRPPGPNSNFVRGKSGYVPFWPGGLDDVLFDDGNESAINDNKKGLRTVPPGLSRGLCLPGDEAEDDDHLSLDEFSVTKQRETVSFT
jgi:antiviral helicase SKI2